MSHGEEIYVFAYVKCTTEIFKSNIQSFFRIGNILFKRETHSLDQGFSNFSVPQNFLEDLLR